MPGETSSSGKELMDYSERITPPLISQTSYQEGVMQ